MSRIGKKPIVIPGGVKVDRQGNKFKVTGPKGTLELNCHPSIEVTVENNQLFLKNPDPNDRVLRAMHGTMRALMNNTIIGVTEGYRQELQIFGTGYNVKEQSGKIVLQVGYCNTIELPIPKGVKLEIKIPATKGNEVPAVFSVSGMDKQVLGQFAKNIRRVRPPEPYQGKGIRFSNEHVVRKEGKALASGS